MTSPDRTRAAPPEPVEAELAHATPRRITARVRRWVRLGLKIVPPIMLAAAGWVLWREFHKLDFAAVKAAMAGWGMPSIVLALLLSAVSFLLMGAIEWVGLRWTGARVPLRTPPRWARSWPTLSPTPSARTC